MGQLSDLGRCAITKLLMIVDTCRLESQNLLVHELSSTSKTDLLFAHLYNSDTPPQQYGRTDLNGHCAKHC